MLEYDTMKTIGRKNRYGLGVPPLFKSASDLPLAESVISNGWVVGSPTLAVWGRTFPLLDGFVGFAGRFVYEQSGGAPTDGCYYDGSGHPQVTRTLGGGLWYVDPSGGWGDDKIGMDSQWDTDYQNHYGPNGQTCEITTPQDLYIDTRAGAERYITDTQMPAEITPKDLIVGLQPDGGQMVTVCEPYPSLKGKCK